MPESLNAHDYNVHKTFKPPLTRQATTSDCVINSTHDINTVRQVQVILAMPSLTLVTSLPASSLVEDAMPR